MRKSKTNVTLNRQRNSRRCILSFAITFSASLNNVTQDYFIKVAANWQLLTPFVSKAHLKGENKSQICDFSRYFSRKRKKFSRKCDCIGRNFEPCEWSLRELNSELHYTYYIIKASNGVQTFEMHAS